MDSGNHVNHSHSLASYTSIGIAVASLVAAAVGGYWLFSKMGGNTSAPVKKLESIYAFIYIISYKFAYSSVIF